MLTKLSNGTYHIENPTRQTVWFDFTGLYIGQNRVIDQVGFSEQFEFTSNHTDKYPLLVPLPPLDSMMSDILRRTDGELRCDGYYFNSIHRCAESFAQLARQYYSIDLYRAMLYKRFVRVIYKQKCPVINN